MMAAIRKWLLAGLLVLVPLGITVWVLEWIIATLDQTLLILPGSWHPDKLIGFHIPGFGVLLALSSVLLIGAIASNFFGKKLVSWWDALLSRIPSFAQFIPVSSRFLTRCFQKTAMLFAKLCWSSGRVKASGRLVSKPARRVAMW